MGHRHFIPELRLLPTFSKYKYISKYNMEIIVIDTDLIGSNHYLLIGIVILFSSKSWILEDIKYYGFT